ncbi:hypothetical protein ACFQX8_10110 [Klenkia terrae]|uniref:hypothetical protein n=1 Tax=Klenkia terrae TaxID=1052259 RepID=UPI00362025A8
MREELGRVSGPHGEVALWRRTDDDGAVVTELVVDGVFAMDDVDTSTERALATEALARVDGAELAVLVGGLGLGWTTAAVLRSPGWPRWSWWSSRTPCWAGPPTGCCRGCGAPRTPGWTWWPATSPARSPRAGTTSSCSTWTTDPSSWCTARTPASTGRPG